MAPPRTVQRLAARIVPGFGAVYLRLVRATMRLRRVGADSALPDDGGPVVYCFWHEQLAMMPWVQFRPPTVVPISRSADGELTARLFGHLGVQAVRGSSSRGGALAARGLIAAARAGRDLGITPDGPRGPAHRVQPGATWLARATGRPLLPVAFACTRSLRLHTWDRMVLPLPLCRGLFVYGPHLWVPREVTDQELKQWDRRLESELMRVTDRVRTMLLP